MKSLEYLNTYGQTSVPVTDNRPAGVIFNRVLPLRPINQIFTATTTSVSLDPGIEILEIIQGATANVRYRVKIVTGGSPSLVSSITFPTLPTGVTQTIVGSTYTLSGIDTVAKWNTVKSFTWNLAANYASCPLWFLEVSVIYYDGATASDKTVTWLAYDDLHYWVSEMTSTVTVSATALKVKQVSADITGTNTLTCAGQKVKGLMATNLSSNFTMTATGTVMIAVLTANTSLSVSPRYDLKGRAAITSAFTMNVTGNVVYTDDLRIQIYYDSTRTTFSASMQTYNTDVTVYWGDGTSTTYTGSGTYRNHTISKVFTGSGYRDIKFVSSAVTNFSPDRGADKCYVYKIYNWSRVPAVSNFYLSTSNYLNQIYLNQVPNYLPTNVTSMDQTFAGCTSLNDPNISSWNTGSMTAMSSVFEGCTSLNQSVASWNVSNCTTLQALFRNCTSFNGVINFSFKNGCDARSMLQNCTGYNQDLSGISLSTSIQMDYFLNGATSFSTVNYNKLLIRLANQVAANSDYPRLVTLGVPAGATETTTDYGSGLYTTGQGSYLFLTTSPRSWTITKA